MKHLWKQSWLLYSVEMKRLLDVVVAAMVLQKIRGLIWLWLLNMNYMMLLPLKWKTAVIGNINSGRSGEPIRFRRHSDVLV